VARKRRQQDDGEMLDDDAKELVVGKERKEKDGDEEDTVDLDEVKEDEDDEDDEEDEAKGHVEKSVEDLEKKRLFLNEAEEAMDNLTLEDIREVLKDNDMDPKMAPRLKKLLADVIDEGDVTSMEEAWEEALGVLDEEI